MGEYQDNSLGSRVFQRLREDILSGKYKEHDELRENTLGKRAGGKPDTGQRGTQAAGAGRTGHDHTEQRSVCDRNFIQGYQRYLYPAFYAGRVVCQMGNRAYYGGTAG